MSAVDQVFATLRSQGRKALMPFVTAGDPDLAFTAALIAELAGRGCQLCELGIPYSDPIADGPVIQESYTRALDKRVKLADILAMAVRTTPTVAMPLVAMSSYAIIFRHGVAQFVDDAKAAGISGVIVPDLPVEEATEMARRCQAADLSLIQLVTPTTKRDRALRIAATTTGFIYYVSVTGITGERQSLPPELIDNVSWLRGQTELPICIGFGISRPEHIKTLAPVADGLIVGSAIVRRIIEGDGKPRSDVIRGIGDYAQSLLAALNG